MQELNRFKTDINLAEFSAAIGYQYDKQKSNRNAPVMKHENGETIVIGRDRSNNNYLYFNPNKDSDSGTVIDFVKNRTGETLGQIRKRLRLWLHNPQPQESIFVAVSTKDTMKIANEWAKIETDEHIYSDYNGIKQQLISQLTETGKVKKVGDDLYFMLSDKKGICGFEKHTADGGKYIKEGSRKGIYRHSNLKDAERIIFFENPMDMLAYKQLKKGQEADFYVCTMGSMGEIAKEGIQFIFECNQKAKAIYAVENNDAGEILAERIAELDANEDRCHTYDKAPEGSRNWKDELEIAAKKKIKSTARYRGMMR